MLLHKTMSPYDLIGRSLFYFIEAFTKFIPSVPMSEECAEHLAIRPCEIPEQRRRMHMHMSRYKFGNGSLWMWWHPKPVSWLQLDEFSQPTLVRSSVHTSKFLQNCNMLFRRQELLFGSAKLCDFALPRFMQTPSLIQVYGWIVATFSHFPKPLDVLSSNQLPTNPN